MVMDTGEGVGRTMIRVTCACDAGHLGQAKYPKPQGTQGFTERGVDELGKTFHDLGLFVNPENVLFLYGLTCRMVYLAGFAIVRRRKSQEVMCGQCGRFGSYSVS